MPRQNPCKKKIVVGVTGMFGSGKTTVSRVFRSLGAEVIDADRIAHRCVSSDRQTHKRIVRVFGEKILDRHGRISRKKLAGIAFHDRASLGRLNRILHPSIIRIIKKRIKRTSAKIVVLDAPLLLEAGLKTIVDKLAIVTITRARQLKRLAKRDSLTKENVFRRVKFQIPQSQKVRFADFIIDNSGSLKETRRQVTEVWRRLKVSSISEKG